MKSYVIVAIIVVLLLVGGIFLFSNQTSIPPDLTVPTPTQVPAVSSTPGATTAASPVSSGPKQYTLADVSAHSDATSCYTTINGNVYDLTMWIDQHPGGRDAILSICGKDGTSAFMAMHGGQGRPERELATFLIGVLK
ncbi:MAG: cytochrome b5-like heme/steroid binding domain-containing protein [Candidatus Pacebacteria bacterium]|nr:cytochrome b5-like heme/steroid binding domain-containing protein [Candidatus Paceibacterota bacterium]